MTDTPSPGSRLRQARRAAGISAKALSQTMGIAESAVRNHENGTNSYFGRVKEYASALGVSSVWLAFGEGDGAQTLPAPPESRRPPVALTQLANGKARLEMNMVLPFSLAVQILALVGAEK